MMSSDSENNTKTVCIKCRNSHIVCIFDVDTQNCSYCVKLGIPCKLPSTTWIQQIGKSDTKKTKIGERTSCTECTRRKLCCVYNDGNKYNYDVKCNNCIAHNKPCWPGIYLKGLKPLKLLSGVNDTFTQDNQMDILVKTVFLNAVNDFLPEVDNPYNRLMMNTQRPARARNNYALVTEELVQNGGKQYCMMASYGSGSGSASVGTTYNTNHLRPIPKNMEDLRVKVMTVLSKYHYLGPFLCEFNHVQFSINGGKGYYQPNDFKIQTGMHCDVNFSFTKKEGYGYNQGKNSQRVNSLVAILTVGDSRAIRFERILCADRKEQEVLNELEFELKHGSLFILNPLDERPAHRCNKGLSYWKHGDVRMICKNPECPTLVRKEEESLGSHNDVCSSLNTNACSLSLAFRCCYHRKVIDKSNWLEPLGDEERLLFGLNPLNEKEKKVNNDALKILQTYEKSGDSGKFKSWLESSTQILRD